MSANRHMQDKFSPDPPSGRLGQRVSSVKLETLYAFYGHSRSFSHPKPYIKNDQRKKIYNLVSIIFGLEKTCLARLMLAIQIYITGDQEPIRELRQGLVRRSLLMLVLLLRSISPAVRRRYPTLESLVLDGVMTRKEKQSFESIDAVSDGMLTNEYGTKLIMEEFLEFRANCGALWSYNWVSIPIIYTQVCTLSTYSYFIACLVARQYTGPSHQSLQDIDIVLPIGTVMELVCYVRLLKVAEQIKNPFGDSDEDFDLNFLITRHLRTVHLGLDDLDVNCPPLTDASSGKAASNGAGDSLQLMPGQLLQNERHASELIKY
ncbi:hypothetical protein OUZ56_003156 [Daphnia magna]|uniref:Bestrophin homolog n=1 Tax=Daphnia magna TaxID=35525 RepID=A0ABR0A7W9_9CRUS|nr:hypothetical protein OUZ56_003156 [Daphnia magna]